VQRMDVGWLIIHASYFVLLAAVAVGASFWLDALSWLAGASKVRLRLCGPAKRPSQSIAALRRRDLSP